ncbi:MAG: UbiA-like polyprenyltransferase [Rikenellaceae bacterium]
MIKKYSDLVKLSHTIFALPFALIGFTYAIVVCGYPFEWPLLLKVLLCMLFARNAAMGFNRWADRDIDAANPRTAEREIPAGKISARSAMAFVVINSLLFILTASSINTMTMWLSPVALFVVLIYSYCKRFTSLAHMVLGLGLGIAPMGAYVAVTAEVLALSPMLLSLVVITWCSGFDIMYALQDRDFDIQNGLHSIPSRFSVKGALTISCCLHAVSIAALFAFVYSLPYSLWSWIGFGIFTVILTAEHLLVTPTRQTNIGIAFGTLNGLASLTLAAFIIVGMILGQ